MKKKYESYVWPVYWDRPMVSGEYGAVSSNSVHATKAGLEILKQGGNAFDAAVAVSLVLSVVEPHHSGIGGGSFSLIYSSTDNRVSALDARGIGPLNADKDLFLEDGIVQDEWKDVGGKSVAVPSMYKALDVILKEYGTKSLLEVSEPAIQLAKEGYTQSFTGSITIKDKSVAHKIAISEEFRKLYLKEDNSNYEFGEKIKNPELGELIYNVAKNGVDYFYTGELAEAIVKAINERGGVFTVEDLENYKPKFRDPIRTTYRGNEIVGFPPPGGGSTVIEILNILENFDLSSMGYGSSESIHLISEAMKIAFADRSIAMGDPDFVQVNINKLISKDFAEGRAKIIKLDKASDYEPAEGIEANNYPGNTSHFVIMDKYGNAISQTQTIRDWFGSGIVVPGYGFVMNNTMSDFSAKVGVLTSQGLSYGSSNAIEGGKTPLSSMSPTLVFKDSKPYLGIGAAGGPRIITGTAQGIINAIDFGMMPEQLVEVPYITCLTKRQGLELESGLSKDTRQILESYGHEIVNIPKDKVFSCMVNSVMNKDGKYYPSATRRIDGSGGALTSLGQTIYNGIYQD